MKDDQWLVVIVLGGDERHLAELSSSVLPDRFRKGFASERFLLPCLLSYLARSLDEATQAVYCLCPANSSAANERYQSRSARCEVTSRMRVSNPSEIISSSITLLNLRNRQEGNSNRAPGFKRNNARSDVGWPLSSWPTLKKATSAPNVLRIFLFSS